MDPQIDTSVYQIQQTPFFKRLHRNNSEQFERLKEAYDHIRNFDEKPIEMQVKKVRLGKLLRHIKEHMAKPKPIEKPKPKSRHQIRCEELAKAKQKGTEYSRLNSTSTSASTPKLISSKEKTQLQFTASQPLTSKQDWSFRKSLLKRRLDYGNMRSEKNRSKHQRSQTFYLQYSSDSQVCPLGRKGPVREKLRKLLVRYLSEEKTSPEVEQVLEEIAKTKNEYYWDLMGAVKKQQEYIKRYGYFTKKLSDIAMESVGQKGRDQMEIFDSETNITKFDSEICINTYRYSDFDEYLPLPSESLLRLPIPDPDDEYDIPTQDDLNLSMVQLNQPHFMKPIKHLHMTLSAKPSTHSVQDSTKSFGEVIRQTVRNESASMLNDLKKPTTD